MRSVARGSLAVLLVALLLAAPVAAQRMTVIEGGITRPVPVPPGGGAGSVFFQFYPHHERGEVQHFPMVAAPFFTGLDNVLNVTVANQDSNWWNATIVFNGTGAAVSPARTSVSVPPFGSVPVLLTVRPEDPGRVKIEAGIRDAVLPQNPNPRPEDKQSFDFESVAIPPVSIRFLDPPVDGGVDEDGVEYTRQSSMGGGPSTTGFAYARIRPGQTITPRVEIHNPLDVPLGGFELALRTSANEELGTVDVPPLDAKARRVVEFPGYTPVSFADSDSRYGSYFGRYYVSLALKLPIGATPFEAGAASFRIENGAVKGVLPGGATIDVLDGVIVDIYLPKNPRLGVPMRVKYNLTNMGTSAATGKLVVNLEAPENLHYGVQGSESRSEVLRIEAGGTTTGVIPFTPYVSGLWTANHFFQSDRGYGYGGGGGGMFVPGPIRIGVETREAIAGRIGEAIEVEARVWSGEFVENAELRVAARSATYLHRFGQEAPSGPYTPGLTDSIVKATPAVHSLGSIRPGDVVDVTFRVVSAASGNYFAMPYVVVGPFAYTGQTDYSRGSPGPWMPGFPEPGFGSDYKVHFTVVARALVPAFAIAPLSVAFVIFVGTWTLRTRFVK